MYVLYLSQRQVDMSKQKKKDMFYCWAKVTHSYKRRDHRVDVQRFKYDAMFGYGKFRGMQRMVDQRTGEVRHIIKIEI